MRQFELIEGYIPQYEDTGITIIDAHTGDGYIAFDLSDGTYWLSDDASTVRVAESLVNAELVYDNDYGWQIKNPYGPNHDIDQLEDSSEWVPAMKLSVVGRYDFAVLRDMALSPAATQKDIDRLAEWFRKFDDQDWTGECYIVDRHEDISLYPVLVKIDEDEYEVDHWSFDKSDMWSMIEKEGEQ